MTGRVRWLTTVSLALSAVRPSPALTPAIVGAVAPATAAAPVAAVDLEPAPVRLSAMGNADGVAGFDALQPAVAYNATDR